MRSTSKDWFLYDIGLRHERVNGKWLINTNFRKVIGTAIEIRSFGGSNPVNKETVMLILQIDVTKTLLSIFINSYILLFLFKPYILSWDWVI